MAMKTTAKAKKLRIKIDAYIRNLGHKPTEVTLFRDQAEALGVEHGELYLHTGLKINVVMKP